jgi:small multidrug resistance pump
MQSWLFLAAAIVFEIAGTTMMKLSESLTRWWYIPPMLVFYLLALGGLALALKTIEVGIAYAVWAGLGTLLIAIIGIVFFGESVSFLKLASMALVIAGVVGLNLAGTMAGVK